MSLIIKCNAHSDRSPQFALLWKLYWPPYNGSEDIQNTQMYLLSNKPSLGDFFGSYVHVYVCVSSQENGNRNGGKRQPEERQCLGQNGRGANEGKCVHLLPLLSQFIPERGQAQYNTTNFQILQLNASSLYQITVLSLYNLTENNQQFFKVTFTAQELMLDSQKHFNHNTWPHPPQHITL